MYAKFGFSPVAKVAFNEEFAPEDWNSCTETITLM